jgi:hypothetical protein
MSDKPKKLSKFEKRFGTEADCRKFLTKLRWPKGPECVCGSTKVSARSRDLLRCADCKRDISLTAGTLFADSHYSLELWFRAMWHLSNYIAIGGDLQQLLDLGSYHTARNWLLKLTFVMAQLEYEMLDGSVVVNSITVDTVRGRVMILVAVERLADGLPFRFEPSFGVPILPDFKEGRIKLRRITDGRPSSRNQALVEMIEKGSEIETDDKYSGLGLLGFEYLNVTSASSGITSPVIHEVGGKLKPLLRLARGDDHLDCLLDQFVFYFNRRRKKRLARFKSLVEQALKTPQMRNASLHPLKHEL